MRTNIGLFLAKRARLEPHKVGVIFEGREITYQEWNERANRAANAFVGLGIQPGDRVGVLLMNTPEFLECFFGLAKIGAIVVPPILARPAKRWNQSFIEFVSGWGQDKVLWATDYPLLPFQRCLEDVEALNLPIQAKRKLLRDNAQRVFGIA